MKYLKIIILFVFGLSISTCDSGPKVIEADDSTVTDSGSAVDQALNKIKDSANDSDVKINVSPTEGTVRLSELFSNMEKYKGKVIKVRGKTVKVNSMIMDRNWVHIQDGSGNKLDLTITTSETMPLGEVVTIEGTIILNKDFGAGYKYDIIMEGGVLK